MYQINIPEKSQRQLKSELEEAEITRILQYNRLVSNRIHEAIVNAREVVKQCRLQILNIVDSYEDKEFLPQLHDLRIKLKGHTDAEKQEIINYQIRIQQKEIAELTLKRDQIQSFYLQDQLERLETFKDLRIFEPDGIDYLHTESGPETRQSLNKTVNDVAIQMQRRLTRPEILKLVGRLTKRESSIKRSSMKYTSNHSKSKSLKQSGVGWSQIMQQLEPQRELSSTSSSDSPYSAQVGKWTTNPKLKENPNQLPSIQKQSTLWRTSLKHYR